MSRALVLGAALWVAAPTGDVCAQSVLPPVLVERVDAEAPLPEVETVVGLVLTVDATGAVLEVEVVTPASPTLDAAARDAALHFRFTPASKDGVPAAARVRYDFVFPAAPPPPPAAEPEVPEFGARARVKRPVDREPTRRSVSGEALVTTAGTRGDALRTLELLPGVARPAMEEGVLLVRGSGAEDTQLFVDGAQVIRIYHFGGLTSFAPASLIDRIDLFPGSFSVRYGRALGGAVEVRLRDPKADRLHLAGDLNLIDASAMAEGPIGGGWTIAGGVRRSLVDLWLTAAADDLDVELTTAPYYLDYQLLLARQLGTRDHLRIQIYGSLDAAALVAPPDDGDASLHGQIEQATDFHRAQILWKHDYSPRASHEASLTLGTFGFDMGLGPDLRQDIRTLELLGRAEWRVELASWGRLFAGTDVSLQVGDVTYVGPRVIATDGNPIEDELGDLPMTSVDERLTFFRPAGYVELAVRPIAALELAAGLRVDGYTELGEVTVDPRATARWQLDGDTLIKAAFGRFSQPPDYGESVPALAGAELHPEHALHASVGVERSFGARATIGVEGYGKWLTEVITTGEDGTLANAGRGRIFGVEVAAKLLPIGRISGFLSYSLSRSERRDPGGGWRLFDQDQTHNLSAAMSLRLGRGWSSGATVRLGSGNLETPVMGSVYDANRDRYRPVYGAVNSERTPLHFQLDLRIEKQWRLGANGRLALYLDVQNATNRPNEEATLWSYDYRTRGALYGLPIFPSLGLRGEL